MSASTAILQRGTVLVSAGSDARKGDAIEVYDGDALIGTAPLARVKGRLVAAVEIDRIATFPARLRAMNARSLDQAGADILVADAAAFIAGSTAIAELVELRARGPVFALRFDAARAQPRRLVLRADDEAAEAWTVPADGRHTVTFALDRALRPGVAIELVDPESGGTLHRSVLDGTQAVTAALADLARMDAALADMRASQAGMQRRLDTLVDLGRERLLLERLDLFYLLLAERIDRQLPRLPPDTVPPSPPMLWFGPADIEGIGIFDVETDGTREWRWFGPHSTVALRGIADQVRRIILYFHNFAEAEALPGIRVSAGGAAEAVAVRPLDSGYAVDVPLLAGRTHWPDGMLILHLAFDRHQSSEADPRLLSAVFSGAEIVCGP